MDITRRNLVLTALSSPLAGLPNFALGADDTAKMLFVVIDGVESLSSPDLASQVLDRFFALGIPLAVTVICQKAGSNDFVEAITEISAREAGLLEPVLEIKSATDAERYLHLRNAIDFRDCLMNGETGQSSDSGAVPIISVIDRTVEPVSDPYALRAAGFRLQIHPDRKNDAGETINESQYSSIDWGVAQLEGGNFGAIENDPEPALSTLRQLNGPQAIYLSLAGGAALAAEDLLAKCTVWAEKLQSVMLNDGIFLARPMDYLLQGHPGASKYVGLVLDMSGAPEEVRLLAGFAQRLDLAGIPYSALARNGALPRGIKGEICVLPETVESLDQATEIVCTPIITDRRGSEISVPEIVLQRSENRYFWSGPRQDGRYHVALRTSSVQDFSRMIDDDPMTDTVFLLNTGHVITPVHQEAAIRQFDQARNDGKVHFYALGDYVEQTLAPDPVLARFWSTRQRQISAATAPQALSDAEKRTLEEDARLAWQFLQRYSDDTTGLCIGTALTGGVDITNSEITMWDVASQINGIIAAHSLSIIPTSEAEARAELILANLPSKNIGGHALPPSLFSAQNPNNSRSEFDACDTGRFLIALKRLVDSGLTTETRAQTLFDTWDIAATVHDKGPHNFTGGNWHDMTNSHCAHYARNGYIQWGIPMESGYPVLNDNENADQKIRLLYKAAFIGHFGAEPLLLEAMEIGFSPETLYLSEVLFDAQLSWFEETGQLKCVSEAALNFPPWFAFQGLRVDRSGQGAWVISTPGHQAQYQTEAFFAKADVISSKAAFMWATEFPHAYSSQLLQVVRDKARIEGLGFSVGLFIDGLEPMKDYSDVNTNGIILTAIAKMLAR